MKGIIVRSSYKARRGTSLAAAALSFALVAPLAQPVAFAQEAPAAVVGAEAAADTQGKSKMVPNAIYTKGGWRDYGGYHGYAYINKDGRHDDLSSNNEPLKGNVIYLQYVTGKNEVSPVFYTLTDSEGRFSFDLTRKVTDRVHAPAFHLAGVQGGKTRVRVWGENPDPEKYSVVAAGDMNSGRYTTRTNRVQESWNFTSGPAGSRITNGRFVLEEKPNHVGWLAKPESEWTRALDGETGKPTVDGQFPDYGAFGTIKSLAAPNQSMVWWENGEDAGSLPGYYKYQTGQGDRAAGGVEIVGSYLNDEVARQIDAWKDANKGYTAEQERANQERIIKAYQDEHGVGSHIAETVVVPSKDDGTIYLPFKGTYGASRDRIGNVSEDEFGKVAPKYEMDRGSRYGAFTGLAIGKRRHINTDYMYIYPRIEGRDVKNSAFPMNMFQNYADSGTVIAGANMNGLQFPLMSAQPIFDIPEYNSYDNKGRAGSKVTTKAAGLMPNADYAIRWYATDPAGNQTELKGKECIVKSDEKGVLPSCDFQAPEDLKETTVYTAAVVSVDPVSKKMSDRWEIADSFTAVVPEQLPLGSAGEEYPDNNVADLFGNLPDDLAEDAKPKYSADKLPDGLKIDPETGKIAGIPTEPGTTEVTVTREVEVMVEKYVGVTDENGDPVWENPDEEDPAKRIQKTEKSRVAEKQLEEVVTKIVVTDTPLKDGVVGEDYEQEVKPEGFGTLPQGFKIKEGSLKVEGLPDGLEFKDGKITGNPTAPVTASEEKPNVTVTYTLVDQDGNETEHTDVVPLAVGVKTTVDESGKKPVDPTNDKQDTGVKVNNPDDDTKISAKDEDGKDVPVEIDENGNVHVTPGTDVDGPITVTVEDPDLDSGKQDVEVEVNGHKKGRDDNGSEKQPETPKTTVDETGTKPVNPTDDKQDTGIKVHNEDKDTEVTAKDEDGKDIPVEIDENGNVHVTPGTDVDGPITVTVTDPDLPGGKVEVEVEVNGHEKGRDDNNSDFKVDDSGKKPVDPTNEKQDTGVKVQNPDKDTKISAKDEDGKDVPVEIDKDGNVVVTPGEDVDGPITVTIEDPRLPEGKSQVEIDVNGHEKGRDDNGKAETNVNADGKKPVVPNGKEQDTGVIINNKDGDTKESATDKNGKDVPVRVGDDGKVYVTPGKDVEGPIKLVVEDPDLPDGKAEIEIEVDKAQNPGGEENKPGTGDQTDPSEGDKLGDNVVASYPKTDVRPGATGTAKVQLNKKDGEKVGEAVDTPKGTTATITKRNGGELHGAKWDINTEASANVTGQAPSTEDLMKAFKTADAKGWDDFTKKFAPLANPSVDLTVKNSTGEHTGVKASFTLVGQDGKSILDADGDFDGDGVNNGDELKKGLNPFDGNDGKINAGRCAASAVGFGLPLIALLPLGLASQIQIPGLSDFAAQASAQLQAANTRIQQQAGIFNPEMAKQVEQINAQLRTVGADLGMVVGGIALIAAGILAGTIIYDNCKPGGPSSSVKDLELKGSSGKTTKLSSEKEQK